MKIESCCREQLRTHDGLVPFIFKISITVHKECASQTEELIDTHFLSPAVSFPNFIFNLRDGLLESASSNDKSCEPSLSSNNFFLLCFLCLCFLCFFWSGNSFVSEIHQLHSFFNLITIIVINLAFNNTLPNKEIAAMTMNYEQWKNTAVAYSPITGHNTSICLLGVRNITKSCLDIYLLSVCYIQSTWTSQSKHKTEKKYKFSNIL
jgi:hypothetical protein